jgi:hypothetical protein
VREGRTAFAGSPAQNQQVTKRVRFRCVTGMCRNLNRIVERSRKYVSSENACIGSDKSIYAFGSDSLNQI